MKNENICTIGMVAKRLGVTREAIHKKRREGRFPSAFQLEDGTWLIDKKDVESYQVNPSGRPRTKQARLTSDER